MPPASKLRASCLAASAAVTCVIALALPASASAAPLIGVQGVSGDPALLGPDLDRVAAAHMRVIRVQANWAQLQPDGPDSYDPGALAGLDRIMAAAAARHIKVVLFADATPCWASAAPDADRGSCSGPTTQAVYRYPPRDPQAFATFSAFLAKRYASSLTAYEIWNEPDQSNELYFAGPDKVARYVAMVKAAYRPVKLAAPGVKVLAGSFVGNNGAWLRAMYADGVKGYYDGLAVHFYFRPLADMLTTRAVQRRYHDSKPLWLTEFGWTSCYVKGGPAVRFEHACLTESGQASALSYVMRAVAHRSWVAAAITYNLHDETDAYRFGLFDRQGKAKPAYGVLKRLLAHRIGLPPAPTLRLSRSGSHLAIAGRGAIADTYTLQVRMGGRLRYRASIATDRFGKYHFKLPAAVPSRGVRVTVRSTWSGRSATASR